MSKRRNSIDKNGNQSDSLKADDNHSTDGVQTGSSPVNEEPHSQEAPNPSQPRHKKGLSFFKSFSKKVYDLGTNSNTLESTTISSIDGDSQTSDNKSEDTEESGSLVKRSGTFWRRRSEDTVKGSGSTQKADKLKEEAIEVKGSIKEQEAVHKEQEIINGDSESPLNKVDEKNVCEMVAIFKEDGDIDKFIIKTPEEPRTKSNHSVVSEERFTSIISDTNSIFSEKGKKECNKCPACIERNESKDVKSSIEGMDSVDVSKVIKIYETMLTKGNTPTNSSRRSSIAKSVNTNSGSVKRQVGSGKMERVLLPSNSDASSYFDPSLGISSSLYLSFDQGPFAISPTASITQSPPMHPSSYRNLTNDRIVTDRTKGENAKSLVRKDSGHDANISELMSTIEGNIMSKLDSQLNTFSETMQDRLDARFHGYLDRFNSEYNDAKGDVTTTGIAIGDVSRVIRDDVCQIVRDDVCKAVRDDINKVIRESIGKVVKELVEANSREIVRIVSENMETKMQQFKSFDTLSEKVIGNFERKLSSTDYGSALDGMNSRLSDLNASLDLLNSKVGAIKNANAEIHEKMLTCKTLASSMDECKIKINECRGSVNEFKGNVDYCKGAMSDCRNRINDCRDKIEQMKEVNRDIQRKMVSLKDVSGTLDAIKDKTASINISVNNINGTMRSQSTESAQFSSKLEEFTSKLADVQAVHDCLLTSLQSLATAVEAGKSGTPPLEHDSATGIGAMAEINEKINAMTNDMTKLVNVVQSMNELKSSSNYETRIKDEKLTSNETTATTAEPIDSQLETKGNTQTRSQATDPMHKSGEEAQQPCNFINGQAHTAKAEVIYPSTFETPTIYTIDQSNTYATIQEPVYTIEQPIYTTTTPLVETVPSEYGNADTISEHSAIQNAMNYPVQTFLQSTIHNAVPGTYVATFGQDQMLHRTDTQVSWVPLNGRLIKHTKKHVTLPEIAQEYIITPTPVALQLTNQLYTIQ
ncbi:hypothetical protein BEWA_002480 [Theileria equi strain WA]|uniref:Uncharacterized protein n=1 Tax=Theileria equi strain WA TaxID=1537102 RepID=L0B0Q2_THEEQ|nr:hypothetical protein BEWA_002480 [Theileria equi strain WA]AFZ80841.1 hypothetical protein BEWA_002480 [Theileria equi strain WA]|eukprot:XP_004830507.1 hypothetical protein BEWA_002480 [Theileria equi strain WA]